MTFPHPSDAVGKNSTFRRKFQVTYFGIVQIINKLTEELKKFYLKVLACK